MLRYLRVALHIWWRLRKAEDRKRLIRKLSRAFKSGTFLPRGSWVEIGVEIGLVEEFLDSWCVLGWSENPPTIAGRYLYAPAGQKPMVVVLELVGGTLVAPARPTGLRAVLSQAFDGYRWFGPIPDAP